MRNYDFKVFYLPISLRCKIVLVTIFLSSIAMTGLGGNFPLNDDWAWGKDVLNILEGKWQYTGWEAMLLAPQALLGAALSLVFHFDFIILRCLSLGLSILMCLFIFDIIYMLTNNVVMSALYSLLTFFNPISYALSFSFMTDIPFLTIISLSVYFFLKYITMNDDKYLYFSSALCSVAACQRQFGVIFGVCYAFALFFKGQFARKDLSKIVITGLLPYLVLSIYELILELNDKTPSQYIKHKFEFFQILNFEHNSLLAHNFAIRSLLIVTYCGFFFFPLVAHALYTGYFSAKRKVAVFCLILLVVLLWYFYFLPGTLLPFYGNILKQTGIGPLALKNADILTLSNIQTLPPLAMYVATLISLLGASCLLTVVFMRVCSLTLSRNKQAIDAIVVFCVLFMVSYSVLVSTFIRFFDRYILTCFLVVSLLLVHHNKFIGKFFVAVTMLWIFVLAGFSIVSERDYLAFNAAKWEALNFLENDLRIDPQRIDGGFEYNGSRLYHPQFHYTENKSWWWVKDDEYIVTPVPLQGYDIIKEFMYTRLLTGGHENILVLKRQM